MLARFVGHELAPVVRDTLSASTDILSLAPLPGLEEAAKALLTVWDACQKVDVSGPLVWTYSPSNALLKRRTVSLACASRNAVRHSSILFGATSLNPEWELPSMSLSSGCAVHLHRCVEVNPGCPFFA